MPGDSAQADPVSSLPQTATEPGPAAPSPSSLPSRTVLIALATTIVGLDQATKALVRIMVPIYDIVPVLPGLFNITHARNTGAAFGFLNAVDIPFKPYLMTVVAAIALVSIIVYSTHAATQFPLSQYGLACVVGGAIGNLIDRVRVGYVLDFIDVYWRGWHFWTFNVADAAISVGAGLLILDMVWVNQHVSETP